LVDCIVTITALALGRFTLYVPAVASGTIVRVWGCGDNPVSGSMAWLPSVVPVVADNAGAPLVPRDVSISSPFCTP
jgi:hypothetical protein